MQGYWAVLRGERTYGSPAPRSHVGARRDVDAPGERVRLDRLLRVLGDRRVKPQRFEEGRLQQRWAAGRGVAAGTASARVTLAWVYGNRSTTSS